MCVCVCVPDPSDGRVRAAGGRHFDVAVVAQDSHGVEPIQRHRMVHHCLEQLLADDSIHSVKIKVDELTTYDTIDSTRITPTTTLLTEPNQAMTPKAAGHGRQRRRQQQGTADTDCRVPSKSRRSNGSCWTGSAAVYVRAVKKASWLNSKSMCVS